jgi:hypothetical protein
MNTDETWIECFCSRFAVRSVRADIESKPISSRPQGGCYRSHLIDENFPGAAAGMQIAG